MGAMEQLKSLVLDGNPLRSLRRDVVMVRQTIFFNTCNMLMCNVS